VRNSKLSIVTDMARALPFNPNRESTSARC
jgi:hypothetical protein